MVPLPLLRSPPWSHHWLLLLLQESELMSHHVPTTLSPHCSSPHLAQPHLCPAGCCHGLHPGLCSNSLSWSILCITAWEIQPNYTCPDVISMLRKYLLSAPRLSRLSTHSFPHNYFLAFHHDCVCSAKLLSLPLSYCHHPVVWYMRAYRTCHLDKSMQAMLICAHVYVMGLFKNSWGKISMIQLLLRGPVDDFNFLVLAFLFYFWQSYVYEKFFLYTFIIK